MKAFGPFRLDTLNHCLWRSNERAALTPKAFDVLRYLVEHSERLVPHEELLEAVWPQTYVNPEGIRKYILEIRKVLGDRTGDLTFIETLPKRGYQFVAPVTEDRNLSTAAASERQPANMVGRQEGITRLHESLDEALQARRQTVFVTGEAGIGKTTLVDAFHEHAAANNNVLVARGQCIEGFGGLEAYYPVLEALSSLLQSTAGNPLVETFAKHAPAWLSHFPAMLQPEHFQSPQHDTLKATRERMVRELCEVLEAIAVKTSVLLILEDLHWADPSTLDLVSAFARRREPARVFLLATYRPIDVVLSQSPLKGLKQDLLVKQLCREIALEPLKQDEIAEYLQKTFSTASLPRGLADLIHRNSGGNALFMTAIVQNMLRKGVLEARPGSLVLTVPIEAAYPDVPETLQELLEIQLEQLTPEQRRILQSASVAGERFSVWALAATIDSTSGSIEDVCEHLCNRQQFIRWAGIHTAPNGTPSAHFEFRHALYRRALYRSISALTRSRLHLSLSERLEPFCDSRPELAFDLAQHFEAGNDPGRAVRYLNLAAEHAIRRFSYRDSMQILQQAILVVEELVPPLRYQEKIELLRKIGDVHYALGEMSDSAASYEAAAQLAAEAGLRDLQACTLVQLALPLWYIDPVRGEKTCRAALEMSKILPDPVLAARAQMASGTLRLIYDQWRQEDASLCLHAYEVLRDAGCFGQASDVSFLYVLGTYGNYEDTIRQADVLIRTTTNSTVQMQALGAKGLANLCLGRLGDVLRLVRTGIESAERNGEDPWMFINGDAWLRMICGDFEGVRRASRVLMRRDTEQHAVFGRTVARISSGYAEIYQGNWDLALEYFEQVRDPATTPKFFLHWQWRLHASRGAAEARLHSGNIGEARREASRFLEATLGGADPNMLALAWEVKSRIELAAKDRTAAWECVNNALSILKKFRLPLAAWHVHRTAWDLCLADGDSTQAEYHRARAQEKVFELANSFEPEEPLRASFLALPPIQRILGQTASAQSGA